MEIAAQWRAQRFNHRCIQQRIANASGPGSTSLARRGALQHLTGTVQLRGVADSTRRYPIAPGAFKCGVPSGNHLSTS